jgi:hypothetical protein
VASAVAPSADANATKGDADDDQNEEVHVAALA